MGSLLRVRVLTKLCIHRLKLWLRKLGAFCVTCIFVTLTVITRVFIIKVLSIRWMICKVLPVKLAT